MYRLEINVLTGAQTVIQLSPEEESDALARTVAEAVLKTPDALAQQKVASIDRLQFEVLYDHENRVRSLEGKGSVTRDQYSTALINRWKMLS